jgi:c-di-GMP-binding flagellar brake protein YcgR
MSISALIEAFEANEKAGERRSEPRMPMNVEARLKCLNPLTSTGPSIRATVVEISRTGMKIRANREFQPGALVQIMVKNKFYMGTVRHCQHLAEGFETGLKLSESISTATL